MVRRVAVIGSGPSGLSSIKSCLEEGLEPTCFESSDDIGGLWRFKEEPEPGRANIYRSVIINSSKEMTSFSDFPPPAELPNNMHHSQVLHYFRLYAQAFNLLQHIRFQTSVVSVRQRPDFSVSGQWELETEGRDGQKESHVFDAVMVCTGHFTKPHLPLKDFPGIDSFEGRYFHSWEYCDAERLLGKRVVVIGIGNSGGDIAVDISRTAEEVYLSTRSGAWIVSRVGQGGLPCDLVGTSRLALALSGLIPSWAVGTVEEKLNQGLNHRLYGLQPKHGFFAQIPVVNDDLPGRIISGRVQMKPNVKEFHGSSVLFTDGSVVDKVDLVVFATGYNYDFPFLPPPLRAKSGYRLRLFRHVFPPELAHPTLAVVGFIHVLGAINPMAEMQARWATRVFKGLNTLPFIEVMLQDIEKDTHIMHQRFACSERNPLQVDHVPYLDLLAREIGARPSILGLLLRDPKLGLQVLTGPCTPYQYRLTGPGKWAGARQAILSQWDRVLKPFRTRVVPEPEHSPRSRLTLILTVSGAVVLLTSLYRKEILPYVLTHPADLVNKLLDAQRAMWQIRPHSVYYFLKVLHSTFTNCNSPNMVHRVAVIGAGPSGLTSIKNCLDEGLEPTCFESSDDIGGLWKFKTELEPGRANIYHSVVINSSKEMMSFSDFPPPAELPNNMHHSEVLLYFRLYSQAFNLLQHIHFQTSVVSVRQRPDFSVSGQWELETEGRDGQKESHVFDAVMVCTGNFNRPHIPLKDFPGIDSFEGRYFHSWEYYSAEGLHGKRIVVIGIGNSGGDIAVDISRIAEKVYLSTRSGAWIVSRVGERGLPCDLVGASRLDVLMNKLLPSWSAKVMEKKLDHGFDHRLYGLKPRHGFFHRVPVVNDDLPGRIISGRVQIKPNVKEFRGSSVVFTDGSIVDKVDIVVFATGYRYDFPYLPSDLREKDGQRLSLYRHVFFPGMSPSTMAVVGFVRGTGAINPLSEMQARWATRVFKGLNMLPSKEGMLKDIEQDTKRFACPEGSPVQVDYIPYLDSLAREIGARPSILGLLLRDPKLGLQVLTGPCTPYQYRLTGPGKWAGARQAILSQWDRVLKPFRTRVVPAPEHSPHSRLTLILTVSGAVVLLTSLYRKEILPYVLTHPADLVNKLLDAQRAMWQGRL
ncbi:uncharacterized protein FYW47_008645 [Aplochiton taeniatus]